MDDGLRCTSHSAAEAEAVPTSEHDRVVEALEADGTHEISLVWGLPTRVMLQDHQFGEGEQIRYDPRSVKVLR